LSNFIRLGLGAVLRVSVDHTEARNILARLARVADEWIIVAGQGARQD
jgi:hypothetical protein